MAVTMRNSALRRVLGVPPNARGVTTAPLQPSLSVDISTDASSQEKSKKPM